MCLVTVQTVKTACLYQCSHHGDEVVSGPSQVCVPWRSTAAVHKCAAVTCATVGQLRGCHPHCRCLLFWNIFIFLLKFFRLQKCYLYIYYVSSLTNHVTYLLTTEATGTILLWAMKKEGVPQTKDFFQRWKVLYTFMCIRNYLQMKKKKLLVVKFS